MKKHICLVFVIIYLCASYLFSAQSYANNTFLSLNSSIELLGGKEGENGWFVEPPMITFNCSDPDATIYFYYNDQADNLQIFQGQAVEIGLTEKGLQEAIFVMKITWYAQKNEYTETKKTEIIKVATICHELTVKTPAKDEIITHQKEFIISGYISMFVINYFGERKLDLNVSLEINQNMVSFDETNGSFTYKLVLMPGENQISILVRNEAGLTRTKQLLIFLLQEEPILKANPKFLDFDRQTKADLFPLELLLKNETQKEIKVFFAASDPWITLSENQVFVKNVFKLVVFINPSLLPFSSGLLIGSISIEFNDVTSIVPVRLDLVEQRMNITMRLNDPQLQVNNQTVVYEYPPHLYQGNFYIPVRIIFETLAARVSFDAATRRCCILYRDIMITFSDDSKMVQKDQDEILLDSFPRICSGRYFIPVKAFEQIFPLANIEYDTKKQKIVLVY